MSYLTVVYNSSHVRHDPPHALGHIGIEAHPEKPSRAENIIREIKKAQIGKIIPPQNEDIEVLGKVHDPLYLTFLKSLAQSIPDKGYHFPVDFYPKQNKSFTNYVTSLGTYSLDTCTPV